MITNLISLAEQHGAHMPSEFVLITRQLRASIAGEAAGSDAEPVCGILGCFWTVARKDGARQDG